MAHETVQKAAWDQCEYFSFISIPRKTQVWIKMCKTFHHLRQKLISQGNWDCKFCYCPHLQRAIIFLVKARWKQSTSRGVKALTKPTKLFLYKVYKPTLQYFWMFPFIWLLPSHGALAFPLIFVNKLTSTSQGTFFSCFNPWPKSLWWTSISFLMEWSEVK